MQRISYIDTANVIPPVLPSINRQFPLTNLHWSPGDRPLRTIPSLQIELVPQDNKTQHQILGLSDTPLVQLFFLEADSYDSYKQQRKRIQEWTRQVQSIRDPTGFLVIHYVGKGHHRSKSVVSKLFGDFGEHAAQLYLDHTSELEITEMWARFCQSLKNEILDAFSSRVHAFESEIRNLHSTRDIVGWNFGRLFVIKESLATCFESMDFLDDAYQIYIELERMAEPDFFTGSKPNNSVVDIPRSHILDSMLTQTASSFDFYAYLFNREIHLLVSHCVASSLPSVQDKHLGLAVQRALTWIPRLVLELQKLQLPEANILLWQMNSAQHVYGLVTKHSSNSIIDSRGQLLLLRRDALTTLAAAKGFAIKGVPSIVPLEPFECDFPQSQESFEREFFEITEIAIKDFEATHMARSVASLKLELAQIHYNNGDYKTASELLTGLQKIYGESKWRQLSAQVCLLYLECVDKLDEKAKVLQAAWSLLELQPDLSDKYSKQCIAYIDEHKALLPTTHDASQWLNIKVHPYLCGDSHYHIEVTIRSKHALPFIQLQKGIITAQFDDKRGQSRKLVFMSNSINMGGKSKFYTSQFIEGTISITDVTLSLGQQTLKQTFNGVTVEMFQLSTCFHAELSLAKVFTHTKRNLELSIHSPEPVNARVKTQAVDGLQILTEKLESTSLEDFNDAKVTVPALVRLDQPLARIQVVIEYGKGCRHEFIKQVDMSFSVLVHVQEFFREQMILNQFLVSCVTTMPVIVEKASLSRSKRFAVIESDHSESHVVLDGAPVSLLYMLKPDEAKGEDSLTLRLDYRSVQVECDHLIWQLVYNKLDTELQKYRLVIKKALETVSVDSISYVIQSRFQVEATEIDRLVTSELKCIEPGARRNIQAILRDTLEKEIFKTDEDFSHLNSSMQLLSPEPNVDVVHFVNLEFESKDMYTVGEVIPVKLRINSISKWSPKPKENVEFYYELDKFNCDGWIFHGLSRAHFKDHVEVDLVLIPTKAGQLDMVVVDIYSSQQINQEVVQRQKGEKLLIMPEVNQLTVTF